MLFILPKKVRGQFCPNNADSKGTNNFSNIYE